MKMMIKIRKSRVNIKVQMTKRIHLKTIQKVIQKKKIKMGKKKALHQTNPEKNIKKMTAHLQIATIINKNIKMKKKINQK